MRWQRGWVFALSAAAVIGLAGTGQAGWLTLMSGAAGVSEPTATGEVWFNFPAAPMVAVNQLTGTGTIDANAGGGVTHFGGLGVPVLLNLADGTAYLAGGSPPDGVAGRNPTGVAGTPASAFPVSGGEVPSGAALLGITVADGKLTAAASTGGGADLGVGTVDLVDGGWWVITLGPDVKPAPGPTDPPVDVGGLEPLPEQGGVPGVPEPATLALGLLGVALLPARRLARRRE